jgi:hypothetical protein
MGGLCAGSPIDGGLLSVLASISGNFGGQFLPVEPVLWLHLPLAIPPETHVVPLLEKTLFSLYNFENQMTTIHSHFLL